MDGALALARRHHDIDDAHVRQLFRAVGVPAQHHLFGLAHADATRQEAVRAHAGEQVEDDLGQAHLGAGFGDDDVARQRKLEAAAERIALHQRDRRRRAVVALDARVHRIDAQPCVLHQRFAILLADQVDEQRKIAAEAEYAFAAGSDHAVIDRLPAIVVQHLRVASLQFMEYMVQFFHHVLVEAGHADRLHVGPERAPRFVIDQLDLLVLAPRPERGGLIGFIQIRIVVDGQHRFLLRSVTGRILAGSLPAAWDNERCAGNCDSRAGDASRIAGHWHDFVRGGDNSPGTGQA